MSRLKWLRLTELRIKQYKQTLNHLCLCLLKMRFSEFLCLTMDRLQLKFLKLLPTVSLCITMSIMLRTLKSNVPQRKMSLTSFSPQNKPVSPLKDRDKKKKMRVSQLNKPASPVKDSSNWIDQHAIENFKGSSTASICCVTLSLLRQQNRSLSLATTRGRSSRMSTSPLRTTTGVIVGCIARYTKNTFRIRNERLMRPRIITLKRSL